MPARNKAELDTMGHNGGTLHRLHLCDLAGDKNRGRIAKKRTCHANRNLFLPQEFASAHNVLVIRPTLKIPAQVERP